MKKSYQHPTAVLFPVSPEDILTISKNDATDLGAIGSNSWGDLPYFE